MTVGVFPPCFVLLLFSEVYYSVITQTLTCSAGLGLELH